jgi:uncharacterized surface protein with fasciclin (FAS1) repeats
MVRKLILILLVILSGLMTVSAQEAGGARLRFVQLFYGDADVYVDGERVIPHLRYSVATDFLTLDAGSHTVAIVSADQSADTNLPTTLEAADGHDYTIVTMGKFEEGAPNLLTIDQTADFADFDPNGNNAIIVQNLAGAVPVDVWFLDNKVIENLSYGSYGVASAPLGHFGAEAVTAGTKNVLFESQYFAVPNTTSLAYLGGTFPEPVGRYFFTTTDASTFEYLQAHIATPNSNLTIFMELVEAAGLGEALAGEGPFTIFAPTNEAFAAVTLPDIDAIRADPSIVLDMLGYHIVPEYWGPYELTGEHVLDTLSGEGLTVTYDPGVTPIRANFIDTTLQHRTANGVIYLIDTILVPPLVN